jgi:hypothetical protein
VDGVVRDVVRDASEGLAAQVDGVSLLPFIWLF